jgi:hypothetical protein
MKIVVLRMFVQDCPLFRVAELDCHVGAVFIEHFFVYEEARLVGTCRERKSAPVCNRRRPQGINLEWPIHLLPEHRGFSLLNICGRPF